MAGKASGWAAWRAKQQQGGGGKLTPTGKAKANLRTAYQKLNERGDTGRAGRRALAASKQASGALTHAAKRATVGDFAAHVTKRRMAEQALVRPKFQKLGASSGPAPTHAPKRDPYRAPSTQDRAKADSRFRGGAARAALGISAGPRGSAFGRSRIRTR